MDNQQIEKINAEIDRLRKRLVVIESSLGYSLTLKNSIVDYITGRIDSLKWVKENV